MRMAGAAMQNLFGDMGSPDFTGLSNIGQEARTNEGIMAQKSDAMVDNAHMSGAAKVAMADMQAGAIEAQGQAAQQAAIGNAIGQIGGMFGSVVGGMGGGTTAPATTSFAFDSSKISPSAYSPSAAKSYMGTFNNVPSSYNLFGGG